MKRLALVLACVLVLPGCGKLSDWVSVPELTSVVPTVSATPKATTSTWPRSETVARMVDGDTLKLTSGGTVRILGIDSPETKDPRKPVQCGGPESSAWAAATLKPGMPVTLQRDSTQDETDRYGRILAYVEYKRGTETFDFSTESARAGMSRPYIYGGKKVERYAAIDSASAEARILKRGLWSHC